MRTVFTNLQRLGASGWCASELVVEDGKVAGFESKDGAADSVVDAGGAYLFPGAVDLHVHFNEPGRTHWEGFATGTAAAAAGGITYVADMPLNCIPSTTTVAAFQAKLDAVAHQARIDFGLWGGVVPGNADSLQALAAAGVMGFKAFMSPSGTEEFGNSDAATLREAMRQIAPTGLRLALHAEDPAVLGPAADGLKNPSSPEDWLASRPVAAEVSAVRIAADLSRSTGCPITIVHVSAPEVLEVIHEARASGVDIICETCPHYLLLSAEQAADIGPVAKCAPPLRPQATVEALLERLFAGAIDTIGSDHSPSPPKLKSGKSFYDAWGGIAVVQHGLPLLLDRVGIEDADKLCALQKAFTETPARLIDRPEKGRLEIGDDADFFLVSSSARLPEVTAGELLQRHESSAYLGQSCRFEIAGTWLRGTPVIENGQPVGTPAGRFIPGPAHEN